MLNNLLKLNLKMKQFVKQKLDLLLHLPNNKNIWSTATVKQ